jgi:hypothetical protein
MRATILASAAVFLSVGLLSAHVAAGDQHETKGVEPRNVYFEVGPAFGLGLSTSGLGAGPALGLDVGTRLRLGSGGLAVHLRTQYQRYGKSGSVNAPCAVPTATGPCIQEGKLDYDLSEQSLDFGLRLAYQFLPVGDRFFPYAGVAPKLFLLKSTVTSLGQDNKDVSTSVGFAAFGGAAMTLGPGHVFGELEYQWGGLSHPITGDAHLAGFALVLGYRLSL